MKLSAFTFVWIAVSASAQVSDFEDADFKKADSIARLYPHHSLYNLKALADKLTLSLSKDEEKFKAIYTWVCLNIKNDYELYRINRHQREIRKTKAELTIWYKEFSKVLFKKLLDEHTTICTGYAYLVKEMAAQIGILCVIVDGYGRSPGSKLKENYPNHSWNAVNLNGKWYLCDPTWSSGRIDRETMQFVHIYNELFFLTEPNLFIQSHYSLDSAWRFGNRESLTSWIQFKRSAQAESSSLTKVLNRSSPRKLNKER
jgi:Transglutaminase-like superfamily